MVTDQVRWCGVVHSRASVLILIVMEDGHWHGKFSVLVQDSHCLNPYCNGRWSLTEEVSFDNPFGLCLNPYCNGRWSLTHLGWSSLFIWRLNPYCNGRWSLTVLNLNKYNYGNLVLILIVMEDGHWQRRRKTSGTRQYVLILIVMEDGHWPNKEVEYKGKTYTS